MGAELVSSKIIQNLVSSKFRGDCLAFFSMIFETFLIRKLRFSKLFSMAAPHVFFNLGFEKNYSAKLCVCTLVLRLS